MKYKKWLFLILVAAVASVAVVAVWINIESKEHRGQNAVSPKVTYVSLATAEPSGETVIKGPKITYVSAATEEPSGETVIKGPRITYVSAATEEPSGETVIISHQYVDITSSIETLSKNVDVIVIGTVSDVVRSNSRGATYRFDVEETLKGEVEDSIHVVRSAPPWSSDIPPPYTKLNVGERLALYMDRTSATTYRPLVFDNGVFDVEVVDGDTILRPRGIHPDMFAEGATFTMAEIRNAIEPDSDEEGPVGGTQ